MYAELALFDCYLANAVFENKAIHVNIIVKYSKQNSKIIYVAHFNSLVEFPRMCIHF